MELEAVWRICNYEIKNNINKVFDSDPGKLHLNFPGTKKKIL